MRESIKVTLREISVVIFPANTLARVAAAKRKTAIGQIVDEVKPAIEIRRDINHGYAALRSIKRATNKLDHRLTRFQRRLA